MRFIFHITERNDGDNSLHVYVIVIKLSQVLIFEWFGWTWVYRDISFYSKFTFYTYLPVFNIYFISWLSKKNVLVHLIPLSINILMLNIDQSLRLQTLNSTYVFLFQRHDRNLHKRKECISSIRRNPSRHNKKNTSPFFLTVP